MMLSPFEELTTVDAGQVLGITPAAVRGHIHAGDLPAHRDGPAWRIRHVDLDRFAARWEPPRNADQRRSSGPDAIWATLNALEVLGEATTGELATAVGRHDGNVRKYLQVLQLGGHVTRSSDGTYLLTESGRHHTRKEHQRAS